MDSEDAAAREAMGKAVKAVVGRNGGVRAVARLLGKESTYASQVSRWQRGHDVTPAAMSLLARATGETIEFSFGPDESFAVNTKEPPPEWAGAVADAAAENAIRRLVPPELLERLPDFLVRLEDFLQRADEAAHAARGSRGPAV